MSSENPPFHKHLMRFKKKSEDSVESCRSKNIKNTSFGPLNEPEHEFQTPPMRPLTTCTTIFTKYFCTVSYPQVHIYEGAPNAMSTQCELNTMMPLYTNLWSVSPMYAFVHKCRPNRPFGRHRGTCSAWYVAPTVEVCIHS